jgi:hypothetical protein
MPPSRVYAICRTPLQKPIYTCREDPGPPNKALKQTTGYPSGGGTRHFAGSRRLSGYPDRCLALALGGPSGAATTWEISQYPQAQSLAEADC